VSGRVTTHHGCAIGAGDAVAPPSNDLDW